MPYHKNCVYAVPGRSGRRIVTAIEVLVQAGEIGAASEVDTFRHPKVSVLTPGWRIRHLRIQFYGDDYELISVMEVERIVRIAVREDAINFPYHAIVFVLDSREPCPLLKDLDESNMPKTDMVC